MPRAPAWSTTWRSHELRDSATLGGALGVGSCCGSFETIPRRPSTVPPPGTRGERARWRGAHMPQQRPFARTAPLLALLALALAVVAVAAPTAGAASKRRHIGP